MTVCNVIIELKSEEDPAYTKAFKVNFGRMNYIGDNLAAIKPFDFQLIVFRYTANIKYQNEFFTTEELCKTLQTR